MYRRNRAYRAVPAFCFLSSMLMESTYRLCLNVTFLILAQGQP